MTAPTTEVDRIDDELREAAERVRMCLAEAGYPDPRLVALITDTTVSKVVPGISLTVPVAVRFQAFTVAGVIRRCWPCFSSDRKCMPDDYADECTYDGWPA